MTNTNSPERRLPEWKQEIGRRLASLQLSPTCEAEIVEELSLHLDDHYAESLSRGATPEEAYRAALAELSDSELLELELRRVERPATQEPVVLGARRKNMIRDLWQDIRFSIRMIGKHPGFTSVVVFTLALGIGVNTAIFTLFNTQLRPLPVEDPDTVVNLEYRSAKNKEGFSFPNYRYFLDNSQVFSGLIAFFEEGDLMEVKSASEESEELTGNFVSDNFFAVLGGGPILGRTFTPEESSVPGRSPVVVLSYHYWQRRFAGDPNVVGRTLRVNNILLTIIGVMERDFAGLTLETPLRVPDLWLPLIMRAEMPYMDGTPAEKEDIEDAVGNRSHGWLNVAGRLKPGKTLEEARAETRLLLNQIATAYPEIDGKDSVSVTPFSGLGENRAGFWGVLGIVLAVTGMVLLIACSNIANLLLARGASRQKEIGVRLCLGASRGRVIRQLLTESFLLASLGGAVGLLLAWWSLELLRIIAINRTWGSYPERLSLDFSPDIRILAFTFLLSLLSSIAFGLITALRATRTDLVATIKDEGTSFGQRVDRSRLRSGLVVAQVALCLLLLIPAGLLLHGVIRLLAIDPGFETKKVLAVRYSLGLSGYDESRAKLFHQQLMARLTTLPGVTAVCEGGHPLSKGMNATIALQGENGAVSGQHLRVSTQTVTPPYFEIAGIPIVRGRSFTAEEIRARSEVIVVSESTARNLWPNQDPIGKTMWMELGNDGGEGTFPAARVIGVARVGHTRQVAEHLPHCDLRVSFIIQPEVGQVFDDRGIRINLSLFHQLHHGSGDERLRDRSHVKQRLRGDLVILVLKVSHAETRGVDHLLILNDGNRKTRNAPLLHHLLNNRLELGLETVLGLLSLKLMGREGERQDQDHRVKSFSHNQILLRNPGYASLPACLTSITRTLIEAAHAGSGAYPGAIFILK